MTETDRIAVFGAGFLGTRIAAYLGCSVVSRSYVDLLRLDQIKAFLDEFKPDVVINAAGKTGRPNIDWCEEHREETLRSNVCAAINLSTECSRRGIYFVHLGSGCIYNGYPSDGFTEEDEPNFYEQFYARTKILAEKSLRELPGLILRIRMPIDGIPHERNLIDKLLKYSKIIVIPNSMTTVPHALKSIKGLIDLRRTGTYNLVNPGTASADGLMNMYRTVIDSAHTFSLISLDELNAMTKSPRSNCRLNTDKLDGEGLGLPRIDIAVMECLSARKQLIRAPIND